MNRKFEKTKRLGDNPFLRFSHGLTVVNREVCFCERLKNANKLTVSFDRLNLV